MPKKRNNAWSRQKKQKQIITARLIEISLKVDEYVYDRKPLSNSEAEQFITEVETYKTTCIRDERSLQVIEKLTRCMKAIILEHSKADNDYMDDGDIFHLGHNRPASTSPVYSICDDDRFQFSQAEHIIGNSTDANNGNEIIDLCIDYDEDDNCNSTYTASEDFVRPFPVNVEVDIHRAVSNLSLQEIPISEEPDSCSQSILNNFDDQMQQKDKDTPDKTVSKSSIGNDDKKMKTNNGKNQLPDIATKKIIKLPALIIRPSKIFKPVSSNTTMIKNIKSKSLGDTIAKLKGDAGVLKTVNNNTLNENDIKQVNMCHPASIQIMEHQETTTQEATIRFAVDKSQEKYSQPTYFDHTINSNVVEVTNLTNTNVNNFNTTLCGLSNLERTNETNQILNKEQINNTSSIPGNTAKTKKKRAPRKKKSEEIKISKTKRTTAKKNSNQKIKLPTSEAPTNNFDYIGNTIPKIPIYNDQVINDLSWMENIRFVREIKLDENDQTLNLEESFWDNYHLPASWTDNEFM